MRINTLDYLRGMMAFLIMIYHYFSWTFSSYQSDSFLGIIGIYGVSIFYVLSGLTLFYVYEGKLQINNTAAFFIKRLFRILPLLALSVVLNLVLFSSDYSWTTIFLNITGLFGFIDHDNYITTGAWSIGNELVFYSFFPLIMLLYQKKSYFIELAFLISLGLSIYFSFFELNQHEKLAECWSVYINPFNQIVLFTGGMLIGKLNGNKKNNKLSLLLALSTLLGLYFYTVNGDQIHIVSGYNRFVFLLFSFAITTAFLLFSAKLPPVIDWVFTKLGHISYSVYLLQGIIYWLTNKMVRYSDHPIIALTLAIIFLLIFSWLSYHYFEVKFINLDKRFLKKLHL